MNTMINHAERLIWHLIWHLKWHLNEKQLTLWKLYGNVLAYPVAFVFHLLTFINEIPVFDEETLVFVAVFRPIKAHSRDEI